EVRRYGVRERVVEAARDRVPREPVAVEVSARNAPEVVDEQRGEPRRLVRCEQSVALLEVDAERDELEPRGERSAERGAPQEGGGAAGGRLRGSRSWRRERGGRRSHVSSTPTKRRAAASIRDVNPVA